MFNRHRRIHTGPHRPGTSRKTARRMRLAAREIMVAFAVVLMVFGLAGGNSRAHALGAGGANPARGLFFKASYASPDAPGTGAPGMQQIQPGVLAIPELVSPDATLGASASALNHPDSDYTRVAAGAQIVWHHSGRGGDLLARFAAEQNKRRAAMTGPVPFFLMALVFALMSAVTTGLWRQLKGNARNGNRTGRHSPHRLR